MPEQSNIASVLNTSREALAFARDLAIFALIAILLISPERTVPTFEAIGKALAKAGFTKLSVAGVEQDLTRFQEKVQEARLDNQLVQEKIAQVNKQIAQDPAVSTAARQQLANAADLVDKSNVTLAAAEMGAQKAAQSPVAAADRPDAWVVVIGADRELASSEDEVRRATKAGFSGAFILRREGWYRAVIPLDSRDLAAAQLSNVSARIRNGAYARNLADWCTSLKRSPDNRFQDCAAS